MACHTVLHCFDSLYFGLSFFKEKKRMTLLSWSQEVRGTVCVASGGETSMGCVAGFVLDGVLKRASLSLNV